MATKLLTLIYVTVLRVQGEGTIAEEKLITRNVDWPIKRSELYALYVMCALTLKIYDLLSVYFDAYLLHKCALLLWRAILEELLDHVVAEHVGHKVVGVRKDFGEDRLLLGCGCALQLLLDEARAVLVLRKLHHVTAQIAEAHVGEPIVPAKEGQRVYEMRARQVGN